MIIDTSALLAIFFNETHGPWCADQLQKHRVELRMSTVNLSETLILLKDRQPSYFSHLKDELFKSGIQFMPPTTDQAVLAATARTRYPLNLGDCFAYALAKSEKAPLLTLDSDFRKTDLKLIIPK